MKTIAFLAAAAFAMLVLALIGQGIERELAVLFGRWADLAGLVIVCGVIGLVAARNWDY